MTTTLIPISAATSTSHVRNCWTELEIQRQAGHFCDVEIQCGGRVFPAHKCVLASVSKYFKAMFTTPLTVTSHSSTSVDLNSFSMNAVETFLNIVYTQNDIDTLLIADLIRLADFLQYEWLVGILVDAIRNLLDVDNVFEWWALANELNVSKLQLLTRYFITDNFDQLQGVS